MPMFITQYSYSTRGILNGTTVHILLLKILCSFEPNFGVAVAAPVWFSNWTKAPNFGTLFHSPMIAAIVLPKAG